MDGVVEWSWSSECVINYVAIILQCKQDVKSYKDMRFQMKHQINLWEWEDFAAIVEGIVTSYHRQQPINQ
eukprot:4120095-Ditylum_brightwellii.AAC.1